MIVLTADDLDSILGFENKKLDLNTEQDFMELQLQSWHARWRREALEHYLPLGWSFAIWRDQAKSELLGYVLCQPLLFFRGHTQTLWVEHLSSHSEAVENQLVEIVYGWARDKHLQQIILPKDLEKAVSSWGSCSLDGELIAVNTSKIRN